jgi:prophage maintenance system killer protein
VPATTLTANLTKTNSSTVEILHVACRSAKNWPGRSQPHVFLHCLVGLARNHAFVDGNKRVAFIATALFLRLNGWRLATERLDEIQTMLNLAGGEISEGQFAAWIRANCEKRKPESIHRKK